MQILHKLAKFSPPREDLKNIYVLFVRSLLEQSAVVLHSSLSSENSKDLERVQKSACRLIIGQPMKYKKSLELLDLQNLHTRRNQLSLNFSLKCLKKQRNEKYVSQKTKKSSNENKKYWSFLSYSIIYWKTQKISNTIHGKIIE